MSMETLLQYAGEGRLSVIWDTGISQEPYLPGKPTVINVLLEALASVDKEKLGGYVSDIKGEKLFWKDVSSWIYNKIKGKYLPALQILASQVVEYSHRRLAQLIAKKFIRYIVTTNIDISLENALSECGLIAEKDFLVVSSLSEWQQWDRQFSGPIIFKIWGNIAFPATVEEYLALDIHSLGVFAVEVFHLLFADQYLLYLGWEIHRPAMHTFLANTFPPKSPGLLVVSAQETVLGFESNENIDFAVSSGKDFLDKLCHKMGIDGDCQNTTEHKIDRLVELQRWAEELGIFRCYEVLGNILFRACYIEQALRCREQALEIAKQQMNSNHLYHAFLSLGESYQNMSLDKSLEYYEKSLDISQKLGNVKETSWAYTCLGDIYKEKHNRHLAVSHYQRSLQICEQNGFWEEAADTYLKYGKAFEVDVPGEAITFYEKGLEIYMHLVKVAKVGIAYNHLARMYLQKEEYEQAEKYCLKGLDMAFASGDIAEVARLYSNLGVIFQQQQNFTEAQKFYRKAHKIFTGLFNEQGAATVAHNLQLIENHS